MKFKKFKCEKLCRDESIERVEKAGGFCEWIPLTEEQYKKALFEKIIEEAQEVSVSKDCQELILELADVLEVVESIACAHEIALEKVFEAKKYKLENRGGFRQRKFIKSVTCPENCELAKYYEENKDKYPEIK
jgi:predicted house-cleaning noncanonical NTP pyrophosphatase (MazG superfamily)